MGIKIRIPWIDYLPWAYILTYTHEYARAQTRPRMFTRKHLHRYISTQTLTCARKVTCASTLARARTHTHVSIHASRHTDAYTLIPHTFKHVHAQARAYVSSHSHTIIRVHAITHDYVSTHTQASTRPHASTYARIHAPRKNSHTLSRAHTCVCTYAIYTRDEHLNI